MIIGLSGSTEAFAALPPDLCIDFFAEIARTDRRGAHLIVVPRAIAEWAVGELDLSRRDAAQIIRLGQQFTQSGQFVSGASPKVIVDPTATEWVFANGVISVPPEILVRGDLLQPVALIAEDEQSDGAFYQWLVSAFAKRSQNFPPVQLQLLHGGGGGMVRVVSRKVREQDRLYVAVVDSDKDTPLCAQKPTNKALRKICERSNGLVRFVETPSREIENFLPLHLIESVSGSVADRNLDRLKRASQRGLIDSSFLTFFDFKLGIDVDDFLIRHGRFREKVQWIQDALRASGCVEDGIIIGGFGNSIPEAFNNSDVAKSLLYQYFSGRNWWSDIYFSWLNDLAILFASSGRVSRT